MTLDGTIIHKSGLMTGGRSTHSSGKKWEEKDVQGKAFSSKLDSSDRYFRKKTGLTRVRDKLLADLRELNNSKPRGKSDDNLLTEITRLEPALTVTKDDLVRYYMRLHTYIANN